VGLIRKRGGAYVGFSTSGFDFIVRRVGGDHLPHDQNSAYVGLFGGGVFGGASGFGLDCSLAQRGLVG
jgi:hypothetical protein